MQISVLGRTDKRTCLYTLMKILQPMGNVAIISSNPFFTRLTEDGDPFGHYQNISVFVLDTTADTVWDDIGYAPDDFDYVIMDGMHNEESAVTIYIEGEGTEALDADLFEFIDDIKVIHMGKGKNAVPYTKELMESLEKIEYYRKLFAPSPAMTTQLANILAEPLKLTAKTIVKVANKK